MTNPPVLQAGKDAAERLALDMDFCRELFLVHGVGCHGFQGDDSGTRQSQRSQRVVVEALDQTGRCGQKTVAVPGVGLTGEDHEDGLPDWVATKVTLPAPAAKRRRLTSP